MASGRSDFEEWGAPAIMPQLEQLETWARGVLDLPPEPLPAILAERMTPEEAAVLTANRWAAVHDGNAAHGREMNCQPSSIEWMAARVLRRALEAKAEIEAGNAAAAAAAVGEAQRLVDLLHPDAQRGSKTLKSASLGGRERARQIEQQRKEKHDEWRQLASSCGIPSRRGRAAHIASRTKASVEAVRWFLKRENL